MPQSIEKVNWIVGLSDLHDYFPSYKEFMDYLENSWIVPEHFHFKKPGHSNESENWIELDQTEFNKMISQICDNLEDRETWIDPYKIFWNLHRAVNWHSKMLMIQWIFEHIPINPVVHEFMIYVIWWKEDSTLENTSNSLMRTLSDVSMRIGVVL